MNQQTSNGSTAAVFVFEIGIDQQSVRDFVINLTNWSQKNSGRPLRVNLNCSGGNILDALSLYQEFGRLRAAGHHLTIAVYGRAASSSAWLVQAADWRIIGDQSWLLVHEVQSGVTGTLTAIKRELDRVTDLQNQTISILTSRTNGALTAATIHDHIDGGRDWWIGAAEAKALGLVDLVEVAPPFASAPYPTTPNNTQQ